MKTLKLFIFTFFFAATTTVAMANFTFNSVISTSKELSEEIRFKIQSDIDEPTNFLFNKNVKKLNEDAEILFLITPEQTIKILTINCVNGFATEYLTQLLNKAKLSIDKTMTGKMFKINVKLCFRVV